MNLPLATVVAAAGIGASTLSTRDERKPQMSTNAPIRTRSWLFTPATHPERFGKASAVGADVSILDLEDAVAPKDKGRARSTALDYLAAASAEGSMQALR